MTRVVQLQSPKGLAFTRLAISTALSKGDPDRMANIARERFGAGSLAARIADQGGLDVMAIEKAAVAAGTTASGNWGELLAEHEGAAAEFFALVRERSLLSRIPGLRRVPLQVRMIVPSTGFSAAWVGEGKAVPVSAAVFDEDTLAPLKVASLTVQTKELLRAADPASEMAIRDDLVAALAAAINTSFIDPANTGTAGVEPASVTNGAPSVSATGNGLDDVRALVDVFTGDLERAVLIGSPRTFLAMHDPMVLPTVGAKGGEILGIPAIASTSAGTTLALIDPAAIAVGEGETMIRASDQATIEMSDAPTGSSVATVTATSQVSLFQTNSIAVMAEQVLAWKVARPGVAILEDVDQS